MTTKPRARPFSLSLKPHPARDWLALLFLVMFVGVLLAIAAVLWFVGIETGTLFATAPASRAPAGATKPELDAVLAAYQSRAAATSTLTVPLRDPARP